MSNIIFSCIHCPSICASHYLLQSLVGIQPNLLHIFPLMVRRCESNISFPCMRNPSVCPSRYLLNHSAEFNQTCYLTSPHSKSVSLSIRLTLMLLVTLAASVGICDGAPSTGHSNSVYFQLFANYSFSTKNMLITSSNLFTVQICLNLLNPFKPSFP